MCQPLGCGARGSAGRISLPRALLDSEGTARALAREWLKLRYNLLHCLLCCTVLVRYGVFEEVRGFPGDAIYKNSWRIGTETVETRGCSGRNSSKTLQFCRYGRCEDRVAGPAETPDQLFCREGDALDLLAPTKQVNCSEEKTGEPQLRIRSTSRRW